MSMAARQRNHERKSFQAARKIICLRVKIVAALQSTHCMNTLDYYYDMALLCPSSEIVTTATHSNNIEYPFPINHCTVLLLTYFRRKWNYF